MQNKVQLDAALAHLSQRGAAPLDAAALDEAAGVGVVVRAARPCANLISHQRGSRVHACLVRIEYNDYSTVIFHFGVPCGGQGAEM